MISSRAPKRRGAVWWTTVIFVTALVATAAGLAAATVPGSSSGQAMTICAEIVTKRAQHPDAVDVRPADSVAAIGPHEYRVVGQVEYRTGTGALIRTAGYICHVRYSAPRDHWYLVNLDLDE